MGTKVDTETKLKFTSFFKNMVVELDKDVYGPDNHIAEWHRSTKTEETDGFTVWLPPISSSTTVIASAFAGHQARGGDCEVHYTVSTQPPG